MKERLGFVDSLNPTRRHLTWLSRRVVGSGISGSLDGLLTEKPRKMAEKCTVFASVSVQLFSGILPRQTPDDSGYNLERRIGHQNDPPPLAHIRVICDSSGVSRLLGFSVKAPGMLYASFASYRQRPCE